MQTCPIGNVTEKKLEIYLPKRVTDIKQGLAMKIKRTDQNHDILKQHSVEVDLITT